VNYPGNMKSGYVDWLRLIFGTILTSGLSFVRRVKNHAEIIDPDKGIFRCPVCGACNDEETLIEIAKKKYSVLDYQADLEACEADRTYQERKEDGF